MKNKKTKYSRQIKKLAKKTKLKGPLGKMSSNATKVLGGR